MIFMRVRILLILVELVLAAGCSRPPILLTVQNQSPLTLSNVVVSGSGFSERISSITSGEERRLSIRPQGKSTVRLAYDAGAQHFDSGPQSYFDSDEVHLVMAKVKMNLSVVVSWLEE